MSVGLIMMGQIEVTVGFHKQISLLKTLNNIDIKDMTVLNKFSSV